MTLPLLALTEHKSAILSASLPEAVKIISSPFTPSDLAIELRACFIALALSIALRYNADGL